MGGSSRSTLWETLLSHHNNKITTWEDPRPLPEGWDRVVQHDGVVMFVDRKERVKTVKDPRPPIPEYCIVSVTGHKSKKSSPKCCKEKKKVLKRVG